MGKTLAGFRGRSDLYRFVRTNHARMARLGVGAPDGPTWAETAAWLIERGQRNRDGGLPSADTVSRIWRRVCDDLAAAAAAQAAARAADPRPPRPPAGWAPVPLAVHAEPLPDHPRGRIAQPVPPQPQAVAVPTAGPRAAPPPPPRPPAIPHAPPPPAAGELSEEDIRRARETLGAAFQGLSHADRWRRGGRRG